MVCLVVYGMMVDYGMVGLWVYTSAMEYLPIILQMIWFGKVGWYVWFVMVWLVCGRMFGVVWYSMFVVV